MTSQFTSPAELARFLNIDEERLHGPLNLVEAAPLLGIAASTLRQHALAGHIGYMRIGRTWRFTWQDLAEFVEKHHVDARNPAPSKPGHGASSRRVERRGGSAIRIPDDIKIMEEAERLGLL